MTVPGIKQLVWASTLVAALSTGLMAGVFFAFSAFVMKALARLPIAQGIQAMQSINVTAVTPVFMAALFGSTAVCYSWRCTLSCHGLSRRPSTCSSAACSTWLGPF
jgi:uncharacterized membrane protein